MSYLNNLVAAEPTEHEVSCQLLCQADPSCTHFTFMEGSYLLDSGEPDLQCYLWSRCVSSVPCSSMDCRTSVMGPAEPSMPDTCCDLFTEGRCSSPELKRVPAKDEEECQDRCREEEKCFFYSYSPDSCLLHESCAHRIECQGCRSGPKRPPRSTLPGKGGNVICLC